MIQVDQEALGHPQRPRQAHPGGVQQVQLKSIKKFYVHIIIFKDKWIQNGPKVILVLLDTLSEGPFQIDFTLKNRV